MSLDADGNEWHSFDCELINFIFLLLLRAVKPETPLLSRRLVSPVHSLVCHSEALWGLSGTEVSCAFDDLLPLDRA